MLWREWARIILSPKKMHKRFFFWLLIKKNKIKYSLHSQTPKEMWFYRNFVFHQQTFYFGTGEKFYFWCSFILLNGAKLLCKVSEHYGYSLTTGLKKVQKLSSWNTFKSISRHFSSPTDRSHMYTGSGSYLKELFIVCLKSVKKQELIKTICTNIYVKCT